MTTSNPDFCVSGGGTLFLLQPLTEAARNWIEENLPSGVQKMGDAVAIEHRYILDIVDGARNDGLVFGR